MSIARTALVLEAERNGKKYYLMTPKDTSVGEIFDVCTEFLSHSLQMVDELKKEVEKKKEETKEKLDKVAASVDSTTTN